MGSRAVQAGLELPDPLASQSRVMDFRSSTATPHTYYVSLTKSLVKRVHALDTENLIGWNSGLGNRNLRMIFSTVRRWMDAVTSHIRNRHV